jgi:hypothetical protein
MTISSPSLNSVNDLIFGAGHDNVDRVNEEDEPGDEPNVPDAINLARANNGQGVTRKRESMYVTLFEGE